MSRLGTILNRQYYIIYLVDLQMNLSRHRRNRQLYVINVSRSQLYTGWL